MNLENQDIYGLLSNEQSQRYQKSTSKKLLMGLGLVGMVALAFSVNNYYSSGEFVSLQQAATASEIVPGSTVRFILLKHGRYLVKYDNKEVRTKYESEDPWFDEDSVFLVHPALDGTEGAVSFEAPHTPGEYIIDEDTYAKMREVQPG